VDLEVARAAADPGQTRAVLARLRAAVLSEAGLAAELAEIWQPDRFAERAAEVACAAGVPLDAAQIAQLVRPPPAAAVSDTPAPPGWLPTLVTANGDELVVDWAYFGGRRLAEPLTEQWLGALAYLPFNRLFGVRTSLTVAPAQNGAAPAGLIFHMSRCGSTPTAQMLAASDANLVVSEAPPIDAVVRMDPGKVGLDVAGHAALLAAIVGAFGQAGGGGRRLFVKLDSWHTRALPLFRRAFPSTPWVFLYRDPTEVMVSHMRQRGMHLAPELVAPSFLGVEWRGEPPEEDYAARVLAAVCEAALAALRKGGGLLVNYSELPRALADRILPHCGVDASPEARAAMQAIAKRDAKNPVAAFAPDSAAKQAAATPAIRAAVLRHLADVYARLEAARRLQTP